MTPGDALLGLEVPCDRITPGAVREALAEIEDVGWVLGDAMLVASELVTNAVVHSGCTPEETIEVEIVRSTDGLVISVTDPGHTGTDAAMTQHDETGAGGLGLRVVDQIALRWGAERDGGYTVWAELPITSANAG